MKDYRKEYLDITQELTEIKKNIETMNDKYNDEFWNSKIMKVIWELYDTRNSSEYYNIKDDITNYYDDECWIPFDDLCVMLDLFKTRRIIKRRLWFIKWLIIRNYLYYDKS